MRELLGQLSDIFDRSTKRRLAAAVIGSIAVALLDTIAIALVLPLVDLATGSGTDSSAVSFVSQLLGDPGHDRLVVLLTVSVVALFILKDLGQMAFAWWITGFIFTERIETSARILRHFLTSPYSQVATRSSAELLRTMDAAVMQVFNYTVNGLMYGISNAMSIIAIAVALAVVAPVPTLGVALYFGLAALLFGYLVKPKAVAAGLVMTDASMQGWRTALAALGAIKELHLRGTQEHFVRNYRQAALRGAYSGRTASFLTGLPKYVLEILFILAIGLILLLSQLTRDGGTGGAFGLLALFVAAGFRVLPAVATLLGNISNIKVGQSALGLVRAEVVAARGRTHPAPDAATRWEMADAITVEDVSFRYANSEKPVLDHVSFSVPKGSSLALVGGSGAGKTTLVDLLLGLHKPTAGSISVDGIDIEHNQAAWQRMIGYVPQEVFILDATLAENVAFDADRDCIDEGRLAEALRQAQLEGLVAELPEGVDTPLGEKGSRLSGGQRQRVGIARALYLRPTLVVLDEATSALDNETEHRITETIRGFRGDVTAVVVAHRLSTVRHCDQIIFLKDGRVNAAGTFEELQKQSPEFAHLVRLGSLAPLAGPITGQEPGSLADDDALV